MMMLKHSRQKRVREGRKKNKLENVFFCFFLAWAWIVFFE